MPSSKGDQIRRSGHLVQDPSDAVRVLGRHSTAVRNGRALSAGLATALTTAAALAAGAVALSDTVWGTTPLMLLSVTGHQGKRCHPGPLVSDQDGGAGDDEGRGLDQPGWPGGLGHRVQRHDQGTNPYRACVGDGPDAPSTESDGGRSASWVVALKSGSELSLCVRGRDRPQGPHPSQAHVVTRVRAASAWPPGCNYRRVRRLADC